MSLLKSLIVGPAFLGLWLWFVPFQMLGVEATTPGGWRLVLGGLLAVAGLGVVVWCVLNFALRGRGTPAPFDPPRRLVVSGPYRWVRNPMYVGFGTLLVGEAILLASVEVAAMLLVLAGAAYAFVVLYEEPALERKFGGDYVAYKARVSRWVPKRPARA